MEAIVQMLSIESVSIVGVLLTIIGYLVKDKKKVALTHKEEMTELKTELSNCHTKLEEEYKESSAEIKIIIEKYYTLSSQFLSKIDIIVNRSLK